MFLCISKTEIMIKRIVKLALIIAVVVLGLLQLVPVNHDNPQVDESKEFFTVVEAPESTMSLVKMACYDCHSNETVHPWYSYVAPISFYIEEHVEEGREELNFSTFGEYSEKKADHKLEECVELLEKEVMPLDSYVLLHGEADLTKDQRKELISFFNSLRK